MVIGILAHVDAGKTTLSEAVLYFSGAIRRMGRVDNGDAFLDNYELERSRGITIFSKQAVFMLGNEEATLLDTPGHADFSAEMERTLQVLDYAVLVISGADGVQGHTLTLWRLLKKYGIPVFLFVNKMDQKGTDREALIEELRKKLSGECIDFTEKETEEDRQKFYESIATADEKVLEAFLEQGKVTEEEIGRLIAERKVFPCFFGSALKGTGVKEFLSGLKKYTFKKNYPEEFGARVFKISRDSQGSRLTFLK
ncbi:MAG TPA: translation elongation factor G, partial [Lachnospiraceae bacterium]|nr:translation elongation factor G [Lachnospiraceae bacterium]